MYSTFRSRLTGSILFLTLGFLGVSLLTQGAAPAYSQSAALRSKYGAKKDEINNQISSIQTELNSLNVDLHQVSERKRTLEEEVATLQGEIRNVNELITETKLTIAQLEDQIAQNEAELEEVRGQLQSILHLLQKQNQTSSLELLLSADSLGDAMSGIYNLNNIQSQADRLSQKTQRLTDELAANKARQEEVQRSLENSQYLLASKSDGLKLLLEQTRGEEERYQELINQTQEQEQQAQANLESVEAEYRDEIAREIREAEEAARRAREAEAAAAAAGSGITGGYTERNGGGACRFSAGGNLGVGDGYFIDPTVGWVSQDYWCGAYGGHDGWDIANGMGTPIVAVADGQVERKGYHPSGFGHFILLRHDLPSGKRVYTLYAHMQATSAASGTVRQGQTIGNMGSTGLSTGPHLHFMFISDSYERTRRDVGCFYGSLSCYDPAEYL